MNESTPVLVSACLLGVRCRYDGGERLDRALLDQLRRDGCVIIPICPEQLGGLPTPRPPAEIKGGDGRDVLSGRAVLTNVEGADVTAAYLRGAGEALRLARRLGCRRAVLKEKSPACGVAWIKQGDADVPGMGVAAALLSSEGVELAGW